MCGRGRPLGRAESRPHGRDCCSSVKMRHPCYHNHPTRCRRHIFLRPLRLAEMPPCPRLAEMPPLLLITFSCRIVLPRFSMSLALTISTYFLCSPDSHFEPSSARVRCAAPPSEGARSEGARAEGARAEGDRAGEARAGAPCCVSPGGEVPSLHAARAEVEGASARCSFDFFWRGTCTPPTSLRRTAFGWTPSLLERKHNLLRSRRSTTRRRRCAPLKKLLMNGFQIRSSWQ